MKEFFQNKKVLITGHTGFQGAWLSYILAGWGADVVGVSLAPVTKPNLFTILNLESKLKHNTIDIRNESKIIEIFKKEKPEIVFHLAAQALVLPSYENPIETHTTNIIGTANILEAIRHISSVRSAVIITTDKVYHNEEIEKLYKETDKLGGYDPYSSSKAAADILTNSYIQSFFNPNNTKGKNTPHIAIARSGNVIGGGDWGNFRLVPDIMRAIFEKSEPVVLRNPLSTRPWQHVLEPLKGYIMLAKNLYNLEKEFVGPWNFGPENNDQGHTVKEVVEQAIKIIQKGSLKIQSDNPNHEANKLSLDITKAKQNLNWNPQLSFEQTIDWTCSWYKSYYENPETIESVTKNQINNFFTSSKSKSI